MKKKPIYIFTLVITLSLPFMSCGQMMYKESASGIEYRYIKNGKGKKASEGDHIYFKVVRYFGDSLIYQTPAGNFEEIVYHLDTSSHQKYNLNDIFSLAVVGDSIATRVPMDSLKTSMMNNPINYKSGSYARIIVKIDRIISEEEKQKEDLIKSQAIMQTEKKLIDEYVSKNQLQGSYTGNGVFVDITHAGNATKPIKEGTEVNMYYVGKLLDGTIFDSNTSGGKPTRDALKFVNGQHFVIPGMEEGISQMNKGGKGILIIPSPLAYGERGAGNVIPPNTVILFEVEMTE